MEKSLVTIDSIVRSAMIAMGEESLHKYQRLLQFGLEAAKDFYMDTARNVKTVRLTMNDVKQADLPIDFVDWVKIGIVCQDQIKVFGTKDDLPILIDTDSCGNPKKYDECDCAVNALPVNINVYGGYTFLNYVNENGEIIGGLYGIGGGYTDKGYFRVLPTYGDHGIIQFNSQVNTTDVYMEYISNGFDPSAQTVISSYAAKSVQFYIHWMVAWHKYGAASANAQGAKNEYYTELHKARLRMMNLTTRDILELSRMNYMLAPKN